MDAGRVLLCGGHGFIGRYLACALRRDGWQVRVASRRSVPALDYGSAVQADDWLPWLEGVDAVVNAVGVLRDRVAQPMARIHDAAPRALFDACVQVGVRRVLQISALGIEDSDSAYARSKRAADAHLLALNEAGKLDGVVLRPSLVFGMQGESTRLFLRLAHLPVLALPRAVVEARVQPLAVWDLADAVSALLAARVEQGLIELAGPRAMPLAAYIALLRKQTGRDRPARTVILPECLTHCSARLGDVVPVSPWCSQTLDLLARDNIADAATLAGLIARPATQPEHFLHEAARHELCNENPN